jgi:excinuclease ABC subunit A
VPAPKRSAKSSPKGRKPASSKGSDAIRIRGARVHNLRDVSVDIPRQKLVVVTGVSGSGKSSLTMDTLYAEGQRRYVESLSAYARQFLGRMDKPDVDAIDGLCPAIALEQKVTTRTTRSTVGSLTEIDDYLRLLFARAGRTFHPETGEEVRRHEVRDVVDFLLALPAGARVQVLAPLQTEHERPLRDELKLLQQKGYVRAATPDGTVRIEDLLAGKKLPERDAVRLVVDRFTAPGPEGGPSAEGLSETEARDAADLRTRMADSVQTAFQESYGACVLDVDGTEHAFSTRFELHGMRFEIPSEAFFNYNNPYGACDRCQGFGSVVGIDEQLVVPDRNLSVYEGAIAPWRGEKMGAWLDKLVRNAEAFDFPVHRPYKQLTAEQRRLLWTGNRHFKGIDAFFEYLESKGYKIQYRVMLSRYRGRTTCPDCRGTRLRKDAQYVRIGDASITDLMLRPVGELRAWLRDAGLTDQQRAIAGRILIELRQRLDVMADVGLEYLTLTRPSNTLSGGESQRIHLTRQLGSNLTSSLYILDEPSVGLHPRDTQRLIRVLHRLRDLGNTVVVVEHEEEIMRAADYIIDMGPRAGVHGGHVVAAAPYAELLTDPKSLTASYLSGREAVPVPARRRRVRDTLVVKGARLHNLRDITVRFPLNMLTAVSGVSGSGKTSLVKGILVPALRNALQDFGDKPGEFDGLEGAVKRVSAVELVDQNPIGRSSRSNPVTYVKAYDAIRDLFSKQPAAKVRGLQPKHFSFNVDGGRCDACKGEGEQVVEMQFLADVRLVCEDCDGKRFKPEVLEVTYAGKSIHEVLELSVDEALDFFAEEKEVVRKLQPLADVGLGYVHLGQSASTLSGGEAQRVKLASFLGKGRGADPVLFVFDEPTTGLHFHDIRKLLTAFEALIERGHSVLVVEHNTDVLRAADWIIDLGPEGGEAGGGLVYEGTPEGLAACAESLTGAALGL